MCSRKHLRKQWFLLVNSSRQHSIMAGKSHSQELEVTGHVTFTIRKLRVIEICVQLAFFFILFRTQALNMVFPTLGVIFPHQLRGLINHHRLVQMLTNSSQMYRRLAAHLIPAYCCFSSELVKLGWYLIIPLAYALRLDSLFPPRMKWRWQMILSRMTALEINTSLAHSALAWETWRLWNILKIQYFFKGKQDSFFKMKEIWVKDQI